MDSGIYGNGGKLGMKPHGLKEGFIEDAQTPFVCEKHKELKEYDKYQSKWVCPKCEYVKHLNNPTEYRLRPKVGKYGSYPNTE